MLSADAQDFSVTSLHGRGSEFNGIDPATTCDMTIFPDTCAVGVIVPARGTLQVGLEMEVGALFNSSSRTGAFNGIVDFGRSTDITAVALTDLAGPGHPLDNSLFKNANGIILPSATPVPEPSTGLLIGSGVLLLIRRRCGLRNSP
jgi:hypothetical protein